MPLPLQGFRILDLTIFQNGPWATAMLADMGADVIKIEHPTLGDPGRHANLNPSPDAPDIYFQTMNRNKRSMTLDLKSDHGRQVFYKMARNADAVTQNFRVGVVEKLKVDYERLRAINPKVIYASISGFGSRGPDAQEGVFDQLGQARSGFLNLMALPDGSIRFQAIAALADQMGAIYAAYAIMCAIAARERTGLGQHVETSQLGAMMALQALAINNFLGSRQQHRPADRLKSTNPLYNVYRCADGKWLSLGAVQPDRYWEDICRVIGIPHLGNEARFATLQARAASAPALIAILDEWFGARRRDECLRLLKEAGVLCAPVQDYADLERDPQVIANDYIATVEHPVHGILKQVGIPAKLSATPGAIRSAAPQFGQHTEEVLLEFGYSWEEIASLRGEGVI
jgi:crotonobetainyl-CoA:carnitine CoA-transferase CaiB-like acyl-CoA transferase